MSLTSILSRVHELAKDIAEKVPSWVQKFLLPDLDERIRKIVRAEVDRVMELLEKINSIDKRLAIIESNPLIVAFNSLTVDLASKMVEDFEKRILKGNPLTPNEITRRRELTSRLDSRTITPNEAKELHDLLNKELEEARATGNFLAILAILFLLGLLVAILASGD